MIEIIFVGVTWLIVFTMTVFLFELDQIKKLRKKNDRHKRIVHGWSWANIYPFLDMKQMFINSLNQETTTTASMAKQNSFIFD